MCLSRLLHLRRAVQKAPRRPRDHPRSASPSQPRPPPKAEPPLHLPILLAVFAGRPNEHGEDDRERDREHDHDESDLRREVHDLRVVAAYPSSPSGGSRRRIGEALIREVVVSPYSRKRSSTVLSSSIERRCTLRKKQSSPVMRWHSLTSGISRASSGIRGSRPGAGLIRTIAVSW